MKFLTKEGEMLHYQSVAFITKIKSFIINFPEGPDSPLLDDIKKELFLAEQNHKIIINTYVTPEYLEETQEQLEKKGLLK